MSEKNILVFHGKSDLSIKKKIQLEIQKIPIEHRAMAITHLEGKESSLAIVSNTIYSLPLGCSHQLVVVWNYEKVLSSSNLQKIIINTPQETKVIFISYANLLSGDKKKLNKNSNLELIVEYFVDWKQIKSKIDNFLINHQLKAGRETVDYLVKVFSNEPFAIDLEFEKLSLFFKPHSLITIEKLSGILVDNANQENAYIVVNAFFEKNLLMTLKSFRNYLKNIGEFSLLISLFIKEAILIVKFKEMKKDSSTDSKIFENLGILYEKHKKSLQAKNALFSFKEVLQLLRDLFEIDRNIRLENFYSYEAMKPRVPLKGKFNFERLVYLYLGKNI